MQDSIFYKYRKLFIAGGVALVVIIIGVSVFNVIWNNIYSATVNILVVPSTAKVRIGDQVYDSYGEFRVKPGQYKVEASAEGFVSKSGELTAVANETVDVWLYLEPSDGNSVWYDEHPEDALILGEIKNQYTIDNVNNLKAKYPFLNLLPQKVDYYTGNYSRRINYTIDYEMINNNSDFVLVVKDYTGGNLEAVKTWLTEQGAEINDIEIRYENLTNQSMSGRAE